MTEAQAAELIRAVWNVGSVLASIALVLWLPTIGHVGMWMVGLVARYFD